MPWVMFVLHGKLSGYQPMGAGGGLARAALRQMTVRISRCDVADYFLMR
jgi:hypothetical protein